MYRTNSAFPVYAILVYMYICIPIYGCVCMYVCILADTSEESGDAVRWHVCVDDEYGG